MSRDRHPDRALARMVSGEATAEERKLVARHLIAGCTRCRVWLATAAQASEDPDVLEAAVERAVRSFSTLQARVAAEQAEADALLARLRELPPARQRLLVGNAAAGRNRAVCERLMEEGRGQRHRDAALTLRYAELAVLAAHRFDGRDAEELRGRALADRANAHRIGGDFAASAADFVAAEALFRRCSPDPLVWAELYSLRASLAKDLRSFGEALSLLKRAATRFRRYEDPVRLARVLIQAAQVHELGDEPLAGVEPAKEALRLLTGDEQGLRLIAMETLAALAQASGNAREASALLAEVRPLVAARGTELDALRFDLLTARVERDLGNLEDAERLLKETRSQFLRRNLAQYVAVVALDLASVYAQQGRRVELRKVALEAATLGSRLGIDREAIAALGLLARGEAADAAQVIATVAAAFKGRGRTAQPPPQAS